MMYLQRILGIALMFIGGAMGAPLLIFIGLFLILTKYNYLGNEYGDPRRNGNEQCK